MSKFISSSKLAALAGLVLAQSAQAGVGITVAFEPGSAAIPTLGFWGLIAAALLLAAIGVRMLKSRTPSARMMSVALLAGSLTLALNGESRPSPDNVIKGEDCGGGAINYFAAGEVGGEFNPMLINNCNVPQEVTGYEFPGRVLSCAELIESCPVGSVLRPGAKCDLPFYDETACRDT